MVNYDNITRRGRYISIAPGITATEGYDGLPTLTIRNGGKITHEYRGSSLSFSFPVLTREDKEYLISLAELE